jgi:hypothetical protein
MKFEVESHYFQSSSRSIACEMLRLFAKNEKRNALSQDIEEKNPDRKTAWKWNCRGTSPNTTGESNILLRIPTTWNLHTVFDIIYSNGNLDRKRVDSQSRTVVWNFTNQETERID